MFSKEEINKIEKEFQLAIEDKLKLKEQLTDLFKSCSEIETICLKFYYAFMPISDVATYNPELFLKIIKDTLKAKDLVPWGDKINGELFFNYVLSYRINNENIVDYREQFFNELYPRIKDKNMQDAVLEVNYWCFEKATYKSTDGRTASPLTVLKNAFGRCGEESTLCVAALRSVGLPARQCYTPRWSHCDDNHAWIEVWIDGKWYFTGACEPEAVMNKGWFNSSAQRAMLIHSRVFSTMVTDDIITFKTPKLTEINVLHNYTETTNLTVTVVDNNKPIEDVIVRFEIINYAEFFPIANLRTDKNGKCNLTTGFGDLFVFISKDNKFLYEKVDLRKTNSITFNISEAISFDEKSFDLDICPPIQKPLDEIDISEETLKNHDKKVKSGLKIRKEYESTFFNQDKANEFVSNYEYKEEISNFLINSNGNYEEIIKFIKDISMELKYKVLILKSLRSKDYSDITSEILTNHLKSALKYKDSYDEDIFMNYILRPRVSNEMITDYREFISNYFNSEQIEQFKKQPIKIFEYIKNNIKNYGNIDYSTLSASPKGLLELKLGSEISMKILFVTICRTFGIPARLNPMDLSPQYYKNDWINVENKLQEPEDMGTLILNSSNSTEFEYHKNLSISKLKDGVYQNLYLEHEKSEDKTIKFNLPVGYYRIVTSNRQTNGDILAKVYNVKLEVNKTTEITIELRENLTQPTNLKDIKNLEIKTFKDDKKQLSEILSENNSIVAWLEEGKEPTEHLLNEMLAKKEVFKTLLNKVIFIVRTKEAINNSTLKLTLNEINNIEIVLSTDTSDINNVYDSCEILDKKLPLVIVVNKELKVKFSSAGYNVGIADMLLREI